MLLRSLKSCGSDDIQGFVHFCLTYYYFVETLSNSQYLVLNNSIKTLACLPAPLTLCHPPLNMSSSSGRSIDRSIDR